MIGAGAFWYINRDKPVALEVDGRAIANAETILDRSEAAFAALVKADGATPADRAGCWFAPVPDRSIGARGPQVACGPVLLGVSGTSKPWVLGTVNYSTGSGGDATGAFDSFKAVGDPDTGAFARPDGRGVPSTSDLKPATKGVRAEDGRLLVGAQAMIDEADDAFSVAAEKAGASVAKDSACFFGGTKNKTGQFLTDGELWCGPVLLIDSDPPDVWSRWIFSVGSGDTFALAEPSTPSIVSLTRTLSLDPGVDLVRPDGRRIPDGAGLAPPDSEPIEDRVVVVVDKLPGDVALIKPDDGRLITPSRQFRLTGLARVGKVGSGPEALVAGMGHSLVVVTFDHVPVKGGPSDEGIAQLVVGADKVPFAKWSSLESSGALVLSVPDSAGQVALEVLFDGVRQQISLLTGLRAEGPPAALYRTDTSVGVGEPLAAKAALPVGDPATAGGVITELRLAAWIDKRGWAPAGMAFLVVTTEGWRTTQPCCDLRALKVTPTFGVTPDGGGRVEGVTAGSTSRPDPVFVVPAGFTVGSLELRLHVTFELGGTPGAVDGEPARLAIALPA